MTDTIIDDDINDAPSTNTRSSSSITTTRRPLFIETEVRTDTVTTRRMAAAAANRTIQDVLENTKSPNEYVIRFHLIFKQIIFSFVLFVQWASTNKLHLCSEVTIVCLLKVFCENCLFFYLFSSAYAPTTRPTSYDIPAMARRDLHDGNTSTSLPAQIFSNVRSQISEGVSAIRNRLSNLTGHGNEEETNGLNNSPSRPGTRFSRSSSQSSASGSRQGGYNLRSRPVHSTPRDGENDQPRKTSHGKGRKDNQQPGDIDEDENEENDQDENKNDDNNDNTAIYYLKKVFNAPLDIFDSFWSVLKRLPWWFLIPLLILFAIYTCK